MLSSFHYHYARLVEIIFAVESIQRLLSDPELLEPRVRARARSNRLEGIGISEAPRGTLIHHYKIDDDGMMTWMNLIIATGHNNLAMNQSVKQVAQAYVDGKKIQEGMLNRVEAVIRCLRPLPKLRIATPSGRCRSRSSCSIRMGAWWTKSPVPDPPRFGTHPSADSTMPTLPTSHARTVIIGYGSPIRGDDAIGPLVADRLMDELESPSVSVLSRHILTAELIEELTPRRPGRLPRRRGRRPRR